MSERDDTPKAGADVLAFIRRRHRRAFWPESGRQAMTALAQLFPALHGVGGTDPWDAAEVLRFACSGASHGELLAARFLLSVWNQNADWESVAREEGILTDPDDHQLRFDVFEALGVWDDENRTAFLAWAEEPFWP